MESSYSESSILRTLDDVNYPNSYKFFPNFIDPDNISIHNKIILFANSKYWAVVFECLGYSKKDHEVFLNWYYFGNCIVNMDKQGSKKQFECNTKYSVLMYFDDINELTNPYGILKLGLDSIKIKDCHIPVTGSIPNQINPKLKRELFGNNIGPDILSVLRYNCKHKCLRSDIQEIKKHFSKDLQEIMEINSWHYKPYSNYDNNITGWKPSSYETFQQIAKVLVSKNVKLYKPTLPANNDDYFEMKITK